MNLLIISTVSCVLEYIVPVIIKRIVTHLYTGRNYDAELRTDLLCLKQEIAGISMVDEFSRYAKLQRKYNKLEGALKEKVNERLMSKMKMQLSITCAFRIFNGMLICALLYLYNTEPVIVLPKGTLWPIQTFLSWPSQHEDCISLIMWLVIARLVLYTYKKFDTW